MMLGHGEWTVNGTACWPVMLINMVTLIFLAAVVVAVALLP